jgi:hypothetical protein
MGPRYLLEQGIEVFPLEASIGIHRMAKGNDFPGVGSMEKRVGRNARIVGSLE